METFIKAILGGLLSFVKDWFEEERAAANEWEAKARKHQIESMREAIVVQNEIAKKTKEALPPADPGAWNQLAVCLLLLCCLPLSGCFRFYVAAREAKVVIPEPARPTLPEEPKEFTEREKLLVDYATRLQAAIRSYNEWARKTNEEANLLPADINPPPE